MKTFAIGFGVLLVASQALAVELDYKWKKGSTYRFDVKVDDQMTMSAMGMNIDETITTTSRFSLIIDKVKPTGEASGTIVIESFEAKNKDGQKVAALDKLPKNALKNRVEIDKKGRFTFKEIIYLVVEEDGESMLVSGKASQNGVSGSAQVGDEKVSVYAEFDPKTGALKAGYKAEKIAKPKKTVEVEQNAQDVDILPRQFLELLELPEGDLTAGQTFENKILDNSITTKVEDLTAAQARLAIGIKTDVGTKKTTNDMQQAAGGGGGMPGMPAMPGMDMGGMGGMGMTGDEHAQHQGALAATDMQMKSDGAFKVGFDITKGMLSTIDGTLTTAVKQAGMTMNNKSIVTMKWVP